MSLSTSSLPQDRGADVPADFETLVAHMLAAKRSLSCLEHVSRANSLVTSTRTALEQQTILRARTSFLKNGCSAQTRVLEQVKDHMQGVARESASEFTRVISSLDAADAQLKETIAQLKSTVVETSLRPRDEDEKTLIDFVDESGRDSLLATIKESIDASGQRRAEYERAVHDLDDEMTEITELLLPRAKTIRSTQLRGEEDFDITDALHGMEGAAEEMANDLEGLVNHFDLCVKAIKHSEGGTAAASGIIRNLPEDVDLHLSNMDGSTEEISGEERQEMLAVVQNDAAEVDEVVASIKERISEMEVSYEQVIEHGEMLEELFRETILALKLLEDVGNRLPNYLARGQVFLYHWDEEKAKVSEYLDELVSLTSHWSGFLLAYDELIIEVGRRKDTDRRIREVCRDALAKIDGILEEEVRERDDFRQAHGEFLPVDIWPGLSMQPPRYDITTLDGESDEVPDISASVIKKAIRRVQTAHAKAV